MTNKILLICPTRERSHKIDLFYKHFSENSSITDIVFALDYDNESEYKKIEADNVKYEFGFKNGIIPAINAVAYKYAQNKQYEIIGMLNDDHLIKTKDWDIAMYEQLKDKDIAIAYPNDLFYIDALNMPSKDLYASSIFMTPNIINALGYMANPMFYHTWVDHLWLDLGRKLNCLEYFENIVFEHMHPKANKSEYDEMYASYHLGLEAELSMQKDQKIYNYYVNSCLDNDVEKIRKYLEFYE